MINSTIDYKLIGQRIKQQRKKLDISQEELASKLGISTTYLSKVECGKSHLPLETVAHIAHTIDVSIEYLICGTSTLEKKYHIDCLHDICEKASIKQLDLIIKLAKAVLDE